MKPLLLLHGAIGAADQLAALSLELAKTYKVYTLNFSGHGGMQMPGKAFSIELFAQEVLDFLDKQQLQAVNIFGYSMGGYVAMYLAKQYPQRISKVITLATKFHWTKEIADSEAQMLNADKIVLKLPAFAETLEKRHAPNDWKLVLANTITMLQNLGANNTLQPEDYPAITTPSLLLLGDRDKMVSIDETIAVYKSLPNAQMGMMPDTPHPIEGVNTDTLSFFIERFLKN